MLRRILLVATFLCSFIGRGQISIGIDTAASSYIIPDTIGYIPNWGIHVTLRNYGATTINPTDTIRVYAAVDSGNVIPNYIQFYSGYLSSLTMNNGDTISDNFSASVSPAAFRSGINTVVIWPKANNNISTTADSLFIKVFVDTTGWSTMIGIESHKNNQGFIMYPNPSTDIIYFKSFSEDNPYRKIKIYDMEGRLVITSDFLKKVDVSFLKSGIYTVAVETLSGDQKKIKFLKE